MAIVKADNVTKYTYTGSEGSGDQYIADGYIKTVEKVWIDSYTVAAAIPTTTSILIGKVPKGKKLTDVIVHLPVLTGVGTTGVCQLSTTTVSNTGTVGTLGLMKSGGALTVISSLATESTVRLGPTGFGTEMPADADIYLMINAGSGQGTLITGGTIRTIVKYT